MFTSEVHAMFELLAMLVLDWRIGTLMGLLLVAAVFDYRSHRIPNWLVLSGMLFGLVYNMTYPPLPHTGLVWALEGLGLGFIAFFPLYLLRVMGAGDVKLMAMVGAFIGPFEIIWVLLYTMIVGGVLSIALVLARGTLSRMLVNLKTLFLTNYLDTLSGGRPNFRIDASATAGKLPYGVAIAMGTIGYLILHPLGYL